MQYQNLLIAGLTGLAAASPAERRGGQTVHANFDDIVTLPAVPSLTALGAYKGLSYTGFELTQLGVEGATIAGVKSSTSPNVLASGLQAQVTQGAPIVKTTGQTKSFDFQSFEFGCVLNTEEAVASAPLGCTVTVTGTPVKGGKIAQSFKFVPNGLDPEMLHANLDSRFKDLKEIEFSTDALLTVFTATLYDTFTYKINTGKY